MITALAGAAIAVAVHESGANQWFYGLAVGLRIGWRLLALKRGWKAPLPPGIDRF